MTDPRPRPQYGEYATPEEQAKAMGLPAHVAATGSDDIQEPSSSAPQPVRPPAHDADSDAGPRSDDDASTDPLAAMRLARDRLITMTLLAIGFVWVLLSIPGGVDLAHTIEQTYALQGYTGHYGPVALASTLGLIMNISSVTLWGITCAVSIMRMRRRRRTWYIPVIGAVVSGLITVALTLVAMLSDPGLVSYIESL